MALRAKKPEAVEKRLKALFYGSAGVGKTTAAIQFPRPYLIDTTSTPSYCKKRVVLYFKQLILMR
jgi:GTPase SAR1 family protein